MDLTTVNYYGKQTSNKCGYCKGMNCSDSHGMNAYSMTPQDYQDLIDRGWRRSGHYCYKPNNSDTCCPCYTIRCNALEFKMSKSHKRVLKRMNQFLRNGKRDTAEDEQREEREREQREKNAREERAGTAAGKQNESKASDVPLREPDTADKIIQNIETPPEKDDGSVKSDIKKSVGNIGGHCKKAKQARLERKQANLAAKGLTDFDIQMATTKQNKQNYEKTLTEYMNDAGPDDKHRLKIVIVARKKPHVSDEEFNLYRKYQIIIHNDSPLRLTPTSLQRFLYKSPLKYTKTADGPATGYGSFHQQYWLDDKLIAVGVIDILPYCVSSVYFFYDPDYSFLSLGTYGSLREIEFVQQLASKVPALKYYYMGYYIHSCPKMRYKGRLVPSYLLCPEAYTWQLVTDEILAKLDMHKYQRLDPDVNAIDANDFLEPHLDNVLVLLENNAHMTYREYIQITGEKDAREEIMEYGKLVGKACAHRILYLKM